MKRIGYFAVIAGLFSLPVLGFAQSEKPAADKPTTAMKAEAKEEKMATKPAVRRLTAKSREDARECLSFPTNREIIICAEKYL
jgi:hypothetical protein